MSDSLTQFYSLTEPTPGADTNVWGPLLNTNFVSIDALLANPNPVTHAGTLVTSTVTMDLSQALIWTYTVVGATTFAFSNVPATANRASVVLLALTNGGAGTLTWPGSVTWLSGNAPTFKVSGVDFVRFFTLNQGTTWYGEKLYNSAPTRVLYTNQALTSTATSDASLATFSVPAGTLGANGQALRIVVVGRYVGANNGNIHLKFGATDLYSGSTGPTSNANFAATAWVTRTGATAQLANWGINLATSTIASAIALAGASSPAETLSGAVTIDFRGSVATAGTLSYDFVSVELVSAA